MKLAAATACALASISWAVAANMPPPVDKQFLTERAAFVELLDGQIADWTKTRTCVALAEDRASYKRCGQ